MNYRFADICKAFFAKNEISVDEFDNRLGICACATKVCPKVQMNLWTHMMCRASSIFDGTPGVLAAALFQICWEGIPSILAGDEKGISGSKEEEYRQAMVWDDTANG